MDCLGISCSYVQRLRVSGLLLKDDGCRVGTSALVPLALSPDAFLLSHEALGSSTRDSIFEKKVSMVARGTLTSSFTSIDKISNTGNHLMVARSLGLLYPMPW